VSDVFSPALRQACEDALAPFRTATRDGDDACRPLSRLADFAQAWPTSVPPACVEAARQMARLIAIHRKLDIAYAPQWRPLKPGEVLPAQFYPPLAAMFLACAAALREADDRGIALHLVNGASYALDHAPAAAQTAFGPACDRLVQDLVH
jgi:hypothetical protein